MLKLERAWLRHELKVTADKEISLEEINKLVCAAAILACSGDQSHRRAAFRTATCAYELSGSEDLPLNGALRVVLTRLGNFPSLGTRKDVDGFQSALPVALVTEEMRASDARRVIAHHETLYLTDFQRELWERLVEGKRVALAAPTSAGKSFVLEHFLSTLFAKGSDQAVLYLVPTRALIAQVAADLAEQFAGFGDGVPDIITVPLEADVKLSNRAIYVMTQERAQLMLNTHANFAADVIVTDEAHSIADGSRGVLLQWVIEDLLKRKPTAQTLFASPGIRNLDVFGRLFDLTDITNFISVEPTVLQNFLVVGIENATKGRVSLHTAREAIGSVYKLADIEIGHSLATKIEKLVHVAALLGKGQSNIVYANGADEAEKVAIQLADLRSDREPTEPQLALAALATEAVHPNYVLAECVKRGVAYHYSNIPTQLRRAVEAAAGAGEIEFLVCTSTLLQGVNLPAKNIFMCAPEKGRTKPLQSTDFWNLSGRAGRLRREFQGNIFLIDYEKWKSKPLDGPKDSIITPAIESSVRQHEQQLISVINDKLGGEGADEGALETVFVKLFSDHREGDLTKLLQRLGLDGSASLGGGIVTALSDAEGVIALPSEVLRRSPNISAHKQQRLFNQLQARVALGENEAKKLIPCHPRESDAYQSYSEVLAICHETILGISPAGGLHRFRAVMALKWMKGLPLPHIIEEQIKRDAKKSMRAVIRGTLEIIETQIRFEAVRLFGCYIAVLVHALNEAKMADLASGIPALPLYLEVGASDRTMISFIALGLSRVAAMKLNDLSARKDLETKDALTWLKTRPLDTLGLSPLLLNEVRQIIGS